MSDTSKEAIVARAHEIITETKVELMCRCPSDYTRNGRHAPDCKDYLVDDLNDVFDLVTELDALQSTVDDMREALGDAHVFTHRQCLNGCGYCQCKGPCERYGTGSTPEANND